MKKLATILFLLLLSMASLDAEPQSDTSKGPRMTFESVSYDFGLLEQGGERVTFDFEFTNDGTAPLIITRAKNSCRCISVVHPKKPVKAGEEGVVRVIFDPKDKGVFNKAIEINANIPGGHITLFVTGEVR